MKRHMLGCLALLMLAACSGTDSNKKEKEGVETILPSQVSEVTVMKLVKKAKKEALDAHIQLRTIIVLQMN